MSIHHCITSKFKLLHICGRVRHERLQFDKHFFPVPVLTQAVPTYLALLIFISLG